MEGVFIAGGLRTFIGAKGKAYRTVPAETLASPVLRALHEQNSAHGIETDLVISGNCVAGGGNIARLALLSAGLPDSVPGISVDSQCSSALESVIAAYARVRAGLNTAVIAGGTESTSTQCVRAWNENHPNWARAEQKTYSAAQFIPSALGDNAMLLGADETCRRNGIANGDMIPHIITSHRNAARAREGGVLSSLVLPAFGAEKDEGMKPALPEPLLSRLPPVLPGGVITSASSSRLSDGAAFVTVLSEENARKRAELPLFRIDSAVTVGSCGETSPESLLVALRALFRKSGIPPGRIDRIDYNEAFACLDVLYARNFGNPSNRFGGALAYGHPYGAAGAVVLLHLMKAMELERERYGIAAVPAAGAVASAILIENMSHGT